MTQILGTAVQVEEDRNSGAVAFAITIAAAVIIAVVASVWLALWAINKPMHPDACGDFRGAECMAAISGPQRP